MFENAKVGDRVWSFTEHWGTVDEIKFDEKYYLLIKFDNGRVDSYTFDGRSRLSDTFPTLFWDEIKFEIPEKPFSVEAELRKLKVKEFSRYECNYYLCWDNYYNKINYLSIRWSEIPATVYYFDYCDNLINVIKNINKHKITKEQFFEAYKNVFGGLK